MEPSMISIGPGFSPSKEERNVRRSVDHEQIVRPVQMIPPKAPQRQVDAGDPIDAISSNQNQDKIVAAGTKVLRIYSVEEDGMQLICDLRNKGKKVTPFSTTNVAWSKLRDELIATSSTNGTVVLWNAEKHCRQGTQFKVHTRSATVVHFHRTNDSLFLSGSKDCKMFMYDMRASEPTMSFTSGVNEAIHDVTFCLRQDEDNFFLSADQGGYVKLWDMRNPGCPVSIVQPHQGYVSSISLNRSCPNMIASGGGRDKRIKIWDWRDGTKSSFPIYRVETLAPVGRVYWRPNHASQIASCSVVNDMSMVIWDIRRPHIPVVSYYGHQDSVTDIWWSEQHPHQFISSGKDGLLLLQRCEEGDYTLDHVCDAPLDVAPDGLITVAICDENLMTKKNNKTSWDSQRSTLQLHIPSNRRRERSGHKLSARMFSFDPFLGPMSTSVSCGVPAMAKKTIQPLIFDHLAQTYRLGGDTIINLCEMNAKVADEAGFETHAAYWRHIRALVSQTEFQKIADETVIRPVLPPEEEKREKKLSGKYEDQSNQRIPPPIPELIPEESIPDVLLDYEANGKFNVIDKADLEETDSEEENPIGHFDKLSDFTSSDFYFGPCELRGPGAMDNEEPKCDEFSGLPTEGFSLRPPDDHPRYMSLANLKVDDGWLPDPVDSKWSPESEIKQTLISVAEQGDIQFCATATIVLGPGLTKCMSEYKLEAWVFSYLQMLDRIEQHIVAASVRKHCVLKNITTKTTEGTYIKTELIHLRKPKNAEEAILAKANNGRIPCISSTRQGRCEDCEQVVMPQCVLCKSYIFGLGWSCVMCNHSMHIDHALKWFEQEENDDAFRHPLEVTKQNHNRNRPDEHKARLSVKCPVSWCQCHCNVEINEEVDKIAGEGVVRPHFAIPLHNEKIKEQLDDKNLIQKNEKTLCISYPKSAGRGILKSRLHDGPLPYETLTTALDAMREYSKKDEAGAKGVELVHDTLMWIQALGIEETKQRVERFEEESKKIRRKNRRRAKARREDLGKNERNSVGGKKLEKCKVVEEMEEKKKNDMKIDLSSTSESSSEDEETAEQYKYYHQYHPQQSSERQNFLNRCYGIPDDDDACTDYLKEELDPDVFSTGPTCYESVDFDKIVEDYWARQREIQEELRALKLEGKSFEDSPKKYEDQEYYDYENRTEIPVTRKSGYVIAPIPEEVLENVERENDETDEEQEEKSKKEDLNNDVEKSTSTDPSCSQETSQQIEDIEEEIEITDQLTLCNVLYKKLLASKAFLKPEPHEPSFLVSKFDRKTAAESDEQKEQRRKIYENLTRVEYGDQLQAVIHENRPRSKKKHASGARHAKLSPPQHDKMDQDLCELCKLQV